MNSQDVVGLISLLGVQQAKPRLQSVPSDTNPQGLRSALAFIPADVPRGDGSIPLDDQPTDYWLGVVLAVHRDYGDPAKEIVREWSKRSDRYTDEGFEHAWAQYDPNHANPVTCKSVFRLARHYGWTPEGDASRYKPLSRDGIMSLPPIEWLLKNLLPKVGIGAVFGPSGSGKSFLALQMGIQIALGEPWFGRRTVSAPVTYVMLEGEAGLRNRIEAWELSNGRQIPENFTAIPQAFDFTNESDVADLAAVLPAGGVVIIDTLNRAAPGKDENSSKDMGDVLAGMKALQRATGGLVLIVHHTGKDTSKGMRGHSSLHAALDGAIEVQRSGEGRVWAAAKVKDGSDDIAVPFKLDVVPLGFDADGEMITSCVVNPDLFRPAKQKLPTGKNQALAFKALKACGEQSLSIADAVAVVVGTLNHVESRRRNTRGREIFEQLVAGNFIQVEGDDVSGW